MGRIGGDSFMGSNLLNLILIYFIFGLILFFFNKALRKRLNVEKRKLFSTGYVNEKHKKIDWSIRTIFIVLIFISFFINVTRNPLEPIWILEPYVLLFSLIFICEIVRIIIEKKYAENRNDYIFTTIQLVILSLFVFLVFSTDFFGMLNEEEY